MITAQELLKLAEKQFPIAEYEKSIGDIARGAYVLGYLRAERDSKLTEEDIIRIIGCYHSVSMKFGHDRHTDGEYAQAILEEFKKLKGEKDEKTKVHS